MNWQDYEVEIFEYFKQQFPKAEISKNAMVLGRYSNTPRQIDILIEDYIAGNRIRIVVDGKYFTKRIDVKNVESFIGMLNDCEANKGLLITQEGYSQAAINRAFFDPVDIELDILNFKELKQFQGLGAIIHSEKYGVVVPAPFGWIIDGTARQGAIATMYQRGLTLKQAQIRKEWLYANIWTREAEIDSLEKLLSTQQTNSIMHDPKAKINYLPTIKRDDYPTRLRVIEFSDYPTKEYTGFVEYTDFIFFCVMFTPEPLKKKNIRKMEGILASALPIKIKKEV